MLEVATGSGFNWLAHHPGRETVLGVMLPLTPAARQETLAAWRARRRLPFSASREGYAIAVLNFRITPHPQGGSLVSTETRVFTSEAATRRRFARYWRLIYPGSALIRRSWLAAIARRAEKGT